MEFVKSQSVIVLSPESTNRIELARVLRRNNKYDLIGARGLNPKQVVSERDFAKLLRIWGPEDVRVRREIQNQKKKDNGNSQIFYGSRIEPDGNCRRKRHFLYLITEHPNRDPVVTLYIKDHEDVLSRAAEAQRAKTQILETWMTDRPETVLGSVLGDGEIGATVSSR